MTALRQERSIGELFGQLTQDLSLLVRQETQLAKTEIQEKISRASRDLVALAAGGIVALIGGFAITAAIILLLVDPVGLEPWLAALLVGVLLAGGGYRDAPEGAARPQDSGPGSPPHGGERQGRHPGDQGAAAMNEYERQLGGSGNGDPEARGRSPEEIEREIEATRERMGRDIDELGERLSPSNLKRQAKDAITGKAQDIANNVGESARYTGSRMMDFVYENTSLVAAMGLGAVWLIQQRNKSEISGDRMARFAYTGPERRREGIVGKIADRAGQVGHTVRDSVSSAASAVGERASDLGTQAGEITERPGACG